MPEPAQPTQPARQPIRRSRRRTHNRSALASALLVLVGVLLTSCAAIAGTAGRLPVSSHSSTSHAASPSKAHSPTPTTGAIPTAAAGTALGALAKLQVKGRAPKTGYSRAQFGRGWASVAGCGIRDRILQRDLDHITIQGSTSGCRVLSGQLTDPYTGERIAMKRGIGDPVQIDHVAALSDS